MYGKHKSSICPNSMLYLHLQVPSHHMSASLAQTFGIARARLSLPVHCVQIRDVDIWEKRSTTHQDGVQQRTSSSGSGLLAIHSRFR